VREKAILTGEQRGLHSLARSNNRAQNQEA
jgi:hypothetical protein